MSKNIVSEESMKIIKSRVLCGMKKMIEESTKNDNEFDDLIISFIENERLMLVYRELQKAYNDPNYEMIFDNDDPNKLHDEDLMAYITFYETLNEYYHHGVLTIGQIILLIFVLITIIALILLVS